MTTSMSATAPPICSCCLRPLQGWRHVEVTDRRTAVDYAQMLRDLSDTYFPAARRSCWCRTISAPTSRRRCIRLFPPAEARRLVERFEWHFTLKQAVG